MTFLLFFLSFSLDAKALATSYDCKYTETSASLNHNVDELLVNNYSVVYTVR